MKKLMFIYVGLFMMSGFLSAEKQAEKSHVECFATTCGISFCVDYGHDLTNDERLWIYDTAEAILCGGNTEEETTISL